MNGVNGAMRRFSYQAGAKSGKLTAETPFKAAQVVLGTKDVRCCTDWLGAVFTNPMTYVGTIWNGDKAIENVECKLWENRA